MTVTPVYPPFLTAPANQGRRLITVPATVSGGRWRLPLEAMEAAVTPDTRVFLLCHPHNPLGRAWSAEEVAAVVDFCRRHELVLCSDEIHCDLILDDVVHVPAAHGRRRHRRPRRDPDGAEQDVQPAGPQLRLRRRRRPGPAATRYVQPAAGLFPMPGCFAVAAAEAAYREGGGWLDELLGVPARQPRPARELRRRGVAATAPDARRGHVPRLARRARRAGGATPPAPACTRAWRFRPGPTSATPASSA